MRGGEDALAQLLRSRAVGDVDGSRRARAEYSSDASNYRVVPLAVAFPRSVEEVARLVELCRSEGIALTCRGGGTSVAGNAVGAGVVADFTRHMGGPVAVDAGSMEAVAGPGVILDDLQAAAARCGLRFGPDPSTHSRASIGGMVANNACGAHGVAWGSTADNVVSLEVLDGSGRHFVAGEGLGPLTGVLEGYVGRHAAVLRAELGRFSRQMSGYAAQHLLAERGPHLGRALVGSEGTLGVIVGATLRLVRPPAHTALAVLGFSGIAEAAEACPEILAEGVLALEGMDSRLAGLARDRGRRVPDLPPAPAWLLAEVGGESQASATASASHIARVATMGSRVVAGSQAGALWRLREEGAGAASRTADGRPAWPGWEDAAVPVGRLPDYLRDFTDLVGSHGLDGVLYGHFGEGCVHVRLDFPLEREPGRLRRFVEEAASLVAEYGGSFSGEHGDGRARSELLAKMYSPAALAAFAELKAIFDPQGILNPGIIVSPEGLGASLRLEGALSPPRPGGLRFGGDGGDFSAAVHRCVGIGRCRADNGPAGGVMCPSYLATRREKDSTRGRARVLQEMMQGAVVARDWRAPEVAEALELCLGCKACRADCPVSVDMASYKAEVLFHSFRRRPRPPSHYSMGWLPAWARLGSRSPALANAAIAAVERSRLARRAAGIDARRPLPRLAPQIFSAALFAKAELAGGPRRGEVLLWVDSFSAHFDPDVALDAAALLARAGLEVRLPSRPACCGLSWFATGQFGRARRRAREAVDLLAPAARAQVPIVALEPSCAALLRGDLEELVGDHPGAAEVARGTFTLAEVLSGAAGPLPWSPPGLEGLEVVAQPHCHHRSVMGWEADAELLSSAGVKLRTLPGCCGMAGAFGMESGHYELSEAVASQSFLPGIDAAGGAVLLADGFSCRLQAGHLRGRRPLHLAQLLAAGAACRRG